MMDEFIRWTPIAISMLALFISFLSWKSSTQSTRASIYDRRFEVYSEVERFIGGWMRHGTPDLDQLPDLVGAWNRSHFLFEQKVTDHIRKIWLDAVDADYKAQIVSNKIPGNRNKAIDKKHNYMLEHGDFDKLRAVFASSLKVKT